ncbi:Cro/CI family transcriptional regulator [Methylobacterium sp. 275MFSha3.1]|uniref:transcriptional regulator n=1 Tax=Methylobacterium sp. 275MFSha3.1 TaxID=1502746 RepID=UPI001FCDE7A0|nr:Cro/CI family transcriptional regulator [Methylobacterium sp. 275MFSha3.1]
MNASEIRMAASAVGGLNELAKRLGVSRQALQQWEQVPSKRVIELERILGVHRSRIRPDLYPVEEGQIEARA